MLVFAHIHALVCTNTLTQAYTYTHTLSLSHTHTHTCTHTHTHSHRHTHIHIQCLSHTHTLLHTHTHEHTHTHTHSYIHSSHTYSCTFRLGFVYPLQDVALHRCLPLSSVCCFPDPGGSLLVMSSCHLLLDSPLDLFPLLGCTLCSAWSTYCPSFLLYVQPISTFVSVCIL